MWVLAAVQSAESALKAKTGGPCAQQLHARSCWAACADCSWTSSCCSCCTSRPRILSELYAHDSSRQRVTIASSLEHSATQPSARMIGSAALVASSCTHFTWAKCCKLNMREWAENWHRRKTLSSADKAVSYHIFVKTWRRGTCPEPARPAPKRN